MIIRHGLFTSESVSEGHPDKLADQISDAIVHRFGSLLDYLIQERNQDGVISFAAGETAMDESSGDASGCAPEHRGFLN